MYDTKLTAEQQRTLRTLAQEWNAKCEGDYESTFVGGVAHAYCDSGIMTDGLSAADVAMLSKYFTSEAIHNGAVDIDTLEHWVTLMEEREWQTDLFKFVDAVNSVLTDEQHKNLDSTEAAMSYCWECCE
jgi:hypothetical protein